MGWASGFQAGSQVARQALDVYDRVKEQEGIRAAKALTPQEVQQRQATPEEIGRARAEAQAMAVQDAEVFGLTPQEQVNYAPQMPVEGQRIGLSRYQVGQQTFNQMPNQAEIERARQYAIADVVAERNPTAGLQMRRDIVRAEREDEMAPLQAQALRQQVELGGIQVGQARTAQEKTTNFDAAFAKINDTKYDKPEDKDAAVLAAVAQFRGPEAAAALQANYSTNERNKLLIDGTKFDQTIRQARLKGPAAALKAIDELNDSFTLEIDGFKVTQVNKDGTRVPFLEAKSADEFALSVDSRIREGGAFELAKFRLDEDTKKAQVGYYNAMAKKASQEGGSAANQLSGVQVGYSRDEKGNPIQVMSALRFNRQSGDLESVQIPLERNVVPIGALDPEKIAKAAEQLVGTPVDPTNKKGPQHTFQSARQAITDQIFNQYLGTGGANASLDPAALAKQILANEKPNASAPAAASAPAKTSTNLGLDPNRPKTNVSSVTGVARETPPTAPNLVAAVGQGLDAGQARYKAYLESKIASKQPLTADEEIRAKRFGLK
jgi:hypothetical protein